MTTKHVEEATRPRRMTRSIGLVLVGTAALMLGMPGCDNDRSKPSPGGAAASTTQPSRHSGAHGAYMAGRGAGNTRSSSSAAHPTHVSRGGFGSTGHSAGS